jgi:phosphoesterase RecJ-like protein
MLKLWGIALSRLKLNPAIDLAYSVLTRKDIEAVGAEEHEVSGLVNLLNAIPESKVALLLYETGDGKIKGSLRTESEAVDVSRLAYALNGGGHKKASGFSLPGALLEVNGSWQVA